MENFQLQDILLYLFLLLGVAFILYAAIARNSKQELYKTGKKVEGIIFDLRRKSSSNFDSSDNVSNSVIVRFVTDKLDWITAELKDDFASFYTGQYKVGDKVEILYDEKDPHNFTVLTKQSELRTRLFIAFIGLGFLIFGTYQLLK